MAFFELNIGKISKENQKKFLNNERLKDYKHVLERIFKNTEHMLSEKEEKIINLKSTTSKSMWVDMVERFLSRSEVETINENSEIEKKSFNDLFGLLMSSKKEVRDMAAEKIDNILNDFSDVAESEINAVLSDKKVNDELRKFKRPDQSRYESDDLNDKIIDSLINAVSDNLDISRKFYELKSKLMGVEKLKYHERVAPYGDIGKEYSFKDSVEIVYEVFKNLDEKFSQIFKNLIERGQVDVFPRKGKSGGAFCIKMLKKQPTYILLNHTNRIRDVKTMAHEFGHAINNELIREKQKAINFETILSTAEVASTFMEDFVTKKLMEKADEETRFALIIDKLSEDIATIIRQISCYTFEQELHKEFRKKGYLSKKEIGKIFQKHMSNYMGDFIEQSEGSKNWWVYWSHIRRPFYVYSYASGLIISKSLQRMVNENPDSINEVKNFLSTGLAKSPEKIFLDCGIDITKKEFWTEGLKEVKELLDEAWRVAEKMGKI